jgi:dUTP pyrophosphatase
LNSREEKVLDIFDCREVRIVRLPHAAGLPLPVYHSDHAAGFDLVAAVPAGAPVIIPPYGRAAIATGFAFALPTGMEGQIRSRSGLALHHGITVLNSPGTLDADYRGEVMVILANLSGAPFAVERGARIAQLVLSAIVQASIREVPSLEHSA